MKTALQRQVTATAWQALGFFGALLLLAIGAYFWGSGIEGQIDREADLRQRDHRTLHRLAIGEGEAVARELQANSKSVQNLEQGSDGGAAPGTGGSGKAPAPSSPVDSDSNQPTKPGKPRHHSPPVPPNSGSGGGSAPVAPSAPQVSTPPSEQRAPEGSPPATVPRHESVLESAGATAGDVVNGTGEVLETAKCGLTAPLLCSKP